MGASDGSSGGVDLAYLTRGGNATNGICIDKNCDDHYGAVGICLDDDGSGNNSTESPNSTLQVNGSFSAKVVTVENQDYTMGDRDYFLKDATGDNGYDVVLPAAATCAGRTYIIKKIDSGTGSVTVYSPGCDIDNDSNYILSGQNSALTVISDGSNWQIIGKY